MRRSYSMMATPTTHQTRRYDHRKKSLIEISRHLADIFPFLEYLDVADNFLSGSEIPKLIQLIDDLPTLRYIDITDNPFPPYAVIQLHDFVEDKNNFRDPHYCIKLVSDFSRWGHDDIPYEFRRNLWQLSPEQWKKTENPSLLVNELSLEIRDKPTNLVHYQPAFEKIFNVPCDNGWPFFACVFIATHVSLMLACQEKLTPRVFLQACIALFKRNDIPGFDGKLIVPLVVCFCLLNAAKSPGMALQLVQAILTEDSAEKDMSLGCIAYVDGNYEESLKLFQAGANKGSFCCHLELAYMMLNQHCPVSHPYDPEKLELLFTIAAKDDRLLAEYDLALFYESQCKMVKAFPCYEAARVKLDKNPALKEQVPNQTLYGAQRRIRFREAFIACIDKVIDARVALHIQRLPSFLPGWAAQRQISIKQRSWERLGKPGINQLLKDMGESLLKSFEENENLFNLLKEHLIHLIRHPQTQPPPLHSFMPNIFIPALSNEVRIFQTGRLGAPRRPGIT